MNPSGETVVIGYLESCSAMNAGPAGSLVFSLSLYTMP